MHREMVGDVRVPANASNATSRARGTHQLFDLSSILINGATRPVLTGVDLLGIRTQRSDQDRISVDACSLTTNKDSRRTGGQVGLV